jgi:hypothetical protein
MDDRRKPLYSLREDDLDVEDDISDFVIGLAERVDRLQDAQLAGNVDELSRGAAALALRARELGYPPVVEIAEKIHVGCLELQPDAAERALLELTELARQVRLGHRGAA